MENLQNDYEIQMKLRETLHSNIQLSEKDIIKIEEDIKRLLDILIELKRGDEYFSLMFEQLDDLADELSYFDTFQ